VNYRILYFFHGKNVVILAHALTKGDAVPVVEIERAKRRRELVRIDPDSHIHAQE